MGGTKMHTIATEAFSRVGLAICEVMYAKGVSASENLASFACDLSGGLRKKVGTWRDFSANTQCDIFSGKNLLIYCHNQYNKYFLRWTGDEKLVINGRNSSR